MSKLRSGVFALAMGALMTGCLPSSEKIEAVVPEAPKEAAKSFLEKLQTGDLGAIEPLLHPDIDPAEAREAFIPLLLAVSQSKSFEPQFGSWNWVYRHSEGHHQIAYEIGLDDRFLVVSLFFKEHNNALLLAGMQYQESPNSIIEFNRFTVNNKSGTHYFFLAAAVALPLFCLFCIVLCWRRRPRRRWLWILFILLAWPVVSLNWSTGALTLKILGLNLLGAAFSQAGPLQPMYFELGLPIGALVFLIVKPPPRMKPEPLGAQGATAA